jgi:hypothetical protein
MGANGVDGDGKGVATPLVGLTGNDEFGDS